jgi:hypothetical protein
MDAELVLLKLLSQDNIDESLKLPREELIILVNEILSRNIIDDMILKGYVPFIYNGGRSMSPKMSMLYNIIYDEFKDTTKFDKFNNNKKKCLVSFIKAKIILFLGDSALFDFVKNNCYNFVQRNEYETLEFNRGAYMLDSIELIIKNDNIENDAKISKIEQLYMNETDENIIIRFDEVKQKQIYKFPPILLLKK